MRHGLKLPDVRKSRLSTDEPPTSWDDITSYNNFYEFAGSDDKDLPLRLAPDNLIIDPWSVVVEGECARGGTYVLAGILRGQTLEERIYRHRCVEGWSMVIPWVGFPLSDFIRRCQPTARAASVSWAMGCRAVRLRTPARHAPVASRTTSHTDAPVGSRTKDVVDRLAGKPASRRAAGIDPHDSWTREAKRRRLEGNLAPQR